MSEPNENWPGSTDREMRHFSAGGGLGVAIGSLALSITAFTNGWYWFTGAFVVWSTFCVAAYAHIKAKLIEEKDE